MCNSLEKKLYTNFKEILFKSVYCFNSFGTTNDSAIFFLGPAILIHLDLNEVTQTSLHGALARRQAGQLGSKFSAGRSTKYRDTHPENQRMCPDFWGPF